MSTRTPFFYLSARGTNLDDRLAYGHRIANKFPTKAEALRVAREVLCLDAATVWYSTSTGHQRKAAELSAEVPL